MITKDLIAHIKAELKLGKPDAQIKETLIANNWAHQDVEAAFRQLQQTQLSPFQRFESKLPFPLLYFGLLFLIINFLFSVFTGSVISLGINVVLFAVGIGLFIGLGKLFEFEEPIATKTILIVGVTSVLEVVFSVIAQLLDWPKSVEYRFFLFLLVGNLVVAKKLFSISWLKTINFYITFGIILFLLWASAGYLFFWVHT